MLSNEEGLGLVDLTMYLRVFSVLINAGVSLMRSLAILGQTVTFEPLKAANAQLMADIQGGSPLSKAMSAFPDLFTGFLIGMVRAGEVGGVLDVTLERAADFYQKQLDNRRERYTLFATARMLGGVDQEQHYRRTAKELENKLLIQYFCYMFGAMLGAGVPVLQALEVAAEILPGLNAEEERKAGLSRALMQAREDIRASQSVVPTLQAAGFPVGVFTLFAIGEESGALDRMALAAGDLLEAEIRGRLEAVLGLNYL